MTSQPVVTDGRLGTLMLSHPSTKMPIGFTYVGNVPVNITGKFIYNIGSNTLRGKRFGRKVITDFKSFEQDVKFKRVFRKNRM